MSDIDNGQRWLSRNRPPRVQITYDVEIGDAVEKKELPLVVGILAHLGRGESENLSLSQKKFEPIDRDNFDEFLAGIAPTITIKGLEQPVTFRKMDDFHPLGLLKHTNIPELGALFEERQKLRDMLAKLDGNEAMSYEMQLFIDKQNKAASDVPAPISVAALQDAVALLRAGTEALQTKVALHGRAKEELALAETASTEAVAAAAAAREAVEAVRAKTEEQAKALPAAAAPGTELSQDEAEKNAGVAGLVISAGDELASARKQLEAKDKEVQAAAAAVEAAKVKLSKAALAVEQASAANEKVGEIIKQAASAPPAPAS